MKLEDLDSKFNIYNPFYISNNSRHALKNNSSETFGFYWLFPTDRFKEVEYFSDE